MRSEIGRARADDLAGRVAETGATAVNTGLSYSPGQVLGTSSAYFGAHSYGLAAGRFFTTADTTAHRRVLVIGQTVVTNLFAGQVPVGQTIQLGGSNFQVIGVTAAKGSNGLLDQDDIAIARAMVTNPALVLADEPTGNLDTVSTHDVLDIFSRLNTEGRTIVLITHERDVAARCKRIVKLTDGRISDDRRTVAIDAPPPDYEAAVH